MNRVLEVPLAFRRVGEQKPLVDGKAAQIHPVPETAAFQALEIVISFVGHLLMQDFHRIKPHVRGEIDTGFQASQMLVAKLPKRVSGKSDAIAAPTGRLEDLVRLDLAVSHLRVRPAFNPPQPDPAPAPPRNT